MKITFFFLNRSTMYSIPSTPDMMKQTSVPFGVVISPMADQREDEAPLYLGTSLANGPVRCHRCKGYMSPLMMFMDGGRRLVVYLEIIILTHFGLSF